MPVRIQFEHDLLIIEFGGEVSVTDIRTLITEVLAWEKKLPRTPDRLTDFSQAAGLQIAPRDIREIVQMREMSPPANAIKSAVVGARPVQFGMARMFQSLNRSPHVSVEVFRDRPSALAWLGRTDS